MKRIGNPFDEVAARYDAWFDAEEGQIILAEEVTCLECLMSPVTGRWLEVGVGTGRFAVALGIKEGVDPSASMRALAERHGVRTAGAVGESLPYPDQCFDGALIATTLCFLADVEQSLKECHRVLKGTGRLVVGLIPRDSSWGQLYEQKATEGHPVYSAAQFHTCDEVVDLATHAGFELKTAHSCLFRSPGSAAGKTPSRQGIVEGAGFVAMAFRKRSTVDAQRVEDE